MNVINSVQKVMVSDGNKITNVKIKTKFNIKYIKL